MTKEPAPVDVAKLYTEIAQALSARLKTSRVLMRREVWDGLLIQLDRSGKPLKLPPSQNVPQASDPDDMQNCVGLMHGLPVLIDNSVPGKFALQ